MDALCVSQHSIKLKKLLDNILRPDFQTRSDANFNVLLSHISGKENPELANALLSSDLFTEWIIQACTYWEENTNVHPSANVGRFVLELTGIVSRDDARFLQLSIANAYLRLFDTFRVRKHDCVPSIKLAYIKLMESFLQHKRGIEWIMATNSWIDVLNYCLAPNSTVYVVKESCDFMYNLLESKVHYDEAFCNVVVKRIMQPLLINAVASGNTSQTKEIDQNCLKNKLQPTLRLLITILEQYFKNEWSNRRYQHIPKLFFKENHLQRVIDTYLMLTTNEELALNLSNILYLIHFISLCVDSKAHLITEHEAIPTFEKVFFLIEASVNKKYNTNVMKLTYLIIYYWFLIHTRLLPMTHKDINNDPLIFQNQVAILQIVPIYHFVEKQFDLDWNFEGIDDLREFYIHKLVRQMCQYTVRLVYNYRNMLVSLPYNYQLPMKAMQYIIQSRKYYKRHTALIVFQALVYALNDFIACIKSDRKQLEIALKETNFFFTFMNAVRDLIENFDFTWKDCVESICVVNAVLDFLALTDWPTKLMTESLKLLQLSIVKYMSPNLALLIEEGASDSSLGRLGPLLTEKLKEEEWEIRDSCLEVLTTISELSHTKFPAFQKTLQQENFPILILKLSRDDPESFVRASALKCLQQMIQSSVLWDEFFNEQQLPTHTLNNTKQTNDEQFKEHITPTLRFITTIMEQYLKKECINRGSQHIANLFIKNHRLEQIIEALLTVATDEDLMYELANLAYVIGFVNICVDAKDYMFTEMEIKPVVQKMFCVISDSITKQYCYNVMKLSHVAVRYWHLIRPRLMPCASNIPKDIKKEPLIFENQLVILHSMPAFNFVIFRFNMPINKIFQDDIRDNFANKVMRNMCEYTIRLAYNYRQALAEKKHGYELGTVALDYIKETKPSYDRDQAVIIFQALVYLLKDIVTFTKDDAGLIEIAKNEAEFLNSLLILIGQFIEDFRITWRDCVESICIVGLTLYFISITAWPKKLMTEAFKLLQFAIEKYMSPNLALLVDRTQDSALIMLGPLLVSKLQDSDWEIRESGLRVLTTICELSHNKFPSFQDILLQEKFATLIVNMSTDDPESKVRASALKCLQEMVQNSLLWSERLEEHEVPQKIFHILNNESESSVRLEAAVLMQLLYRHQNLSDDSKPQIYEMMAFSSTLDLQWEVRKKGLQFWNEVIFELLRNQGMIDGSFPNVTFSKEHRKIVTLTEIEIRRRLNKVLLQLSEIGCLGVLLSALQDDCDLEVVKEAVAITKKLITLLNRYNANLNEKQRSPSISSNDFEFGPQVKYARSISNASFNSQSTGSSSVRIITPFYFLEFTQQDLDKLIERRRKWLNGIDSFASFIDEMLKDCDEVSSMDCY